MIESHDNEARNVQVRRRRRRNAGWKSGLVLTGLGAVVLGAGYLSGVNAPAVAQTSTPAVPQTGGEILNQGNNGLLARGDDDNSGLGRGFYFDEDDDHDEDFFVSGGSPQFEGGDGSGSTNQFNQLLGRRSRQLPGFGQQQPNFSGPVTRSRGS